ncbi:MAG: lipocalin family protein [Bacteroidetes bacterium]|nr:lipocalin family protein [Bacteroidota bacterium]
MLSWLFSGKAIPDGAVAVSPFDKSRYLGKWYEIARLDFRFEKDLNNTTAEYSLKENGTIKVYNRGFNVKKNKWQDATGKAKFAGDENTAMLKVSFFGPFYAGYNVIAIDKEYRYALVIGESLKYMWLLSRETTMPEEIKRDYLAKAESIGYATGNLVWVTHDRQPRN